MTAALVLPSQLPDIASAKLPVVYERAKTALLACDRVDECKDWADKAAALASYAKQADDATLMNTAVRIQARATRRCGELLQSFQNARSGAGRPSKLSTGTATQLVTQRKVAEAAGLSKRQEVTARQIAKVPADIFESVIESDRPPTITQLAALGTTPNPPRQAPDGFATATNVLGAINALARQCAEHEPAVVAAGIYRYEVMRTTATANTVLAWLTTFVAALHTEVKC